MISIDLINEIRFLVILVTLIFKHFIDLGVILVDFGGEVILIQQETGVILLVERIATAHYVLLQGAVLLKLISVGLAPPH